MESESSALNPAGEAAAPAASVAVPQTVDTPVAKPVPKRPLLTRRLFILGGFWSGLMLAVVGILGSPLDFMWPRKLGGFGGPIPVTKDRIPQEPGADPVIIPEGRFFLLNLAAGVTPNGEETSGGLIALWRKCPHLGCTVPWRPEFEFQGRKGWFRCPCHGSTYTKEGGVLVAGPAPRPMDVFPLTINEDLSIVVQTGQAKAIKGSTHNPERSIPYEPGNATKV
ncbi:MAG TPA: ubiquinol-cytochrome c reductase iron-sulfur subunit [Dehalococcoidia bacterium]|nr:ubiquinol-cytochrome c reductase iron-sulfur subunit [Dehalococcoidia bacterium]